MFIWGGLTGPPWFFQHKSTAFPTFFTAGCVLFTYNRELGGSHRVYIYFFKAVTWFPGSGYGPCFCSTDGSFGGEVRGTTLLQMKWAAQVYLCGGFATWAELLWGLFFFLLQAVELSEDGRRETETDRTPAYRSDSYVISSPFSRWKRAPARHGTAQQRSLWAHWIGIKAWANFPITKFQVFWVEFGV